MGGDKGSYLWLDWFWPDTLCRWVRPPPPPGVQTPPKGNMHPPHPLTWLVIMIASGVDAGKMPYNTEHLKGFYTERICGTVFTDRCKQISTRIVCGQVDFFQEHSSKRFLSPCPSMHFMVPSDETDLFFLFSSPLTFSFFSFPISSCLHLFHLCLSPSSLLF